MRNNVLEKTVHGKSLKIEKPQTGTALSWKRRSRNKKHLTRGLANVNKLKYMGLGMRAQFNMVTWCII